ncbi:MAG: CHASE2 domain-containing protein [Gammaproteobacteria bacterium]|nr:CHASE2 domain-containing protein [Gammaproteobacteria bacterium]
MFSWLDASLAALGDGFMRAWTKVERSYRRPFSRAARRLGFAYYPLLALLAIGWLAWDWTHDRTLNAAENAIFDQVIRWRPLEPAPSGQVVVVEIDECSIEHFRARGEGGWPWSRQRHADLLERLDRNGARAVGYDVLLTDPSREDPVGDRALEAMALGGAGRFLFAAARMHRDYDAGAPLTASQAPGAFPRFEPPAEDPPVALLMPYGTAMAAASAIVNVARNEDGVLRDLPVYEAAGDYGLPSLPMRLAMAAAGPAPRTFPLSVRPNWREDTRLPRLSAADLLVEFPPVCRRAGAAVPALKDAVVLVGYTAAGLNDAKPTPVDAVMPGVEVLAEATEALVAGSAIRVPPAGLKYLIAALLVLLTAFVFFRGEPHNDIDSIFVATNLLLLGTTFIGLTFFAYFFDVFAAIGFVSLYFGFCRIYARIQRGRAVGNGDYLRDFDPAQDRWLAVARLHFVPDPGLGQRAIVRRRREYRRRLRRFLYAGTDAVMLEGIVEEKTWLHGALSDLVVLMWHGKNEVQARAAAAADLARLERSLAEQDARLPDDGTVRLAFGTGEIATGAASAAGTIPLHALIGQVLVSSAEWPLAQRSIDALQPPPEQGER